MWISALLRSPNHHGLKFTARQKQLPQSGLMAPENPSSLLPLCCGVETPSSGMLASSSS